MKVSLKEKKHATLYKYVIIFDAAWFSSDAQKRSNQPYFWVNKNLWKYIPNIKGLLCCMTLPSVLVPQKKEMEPPNQNASQIARIHINITILKGMPANRRERRAPQK